MSESNLKFDKMQTLNTAQQAYDLLLKACEGSDTPTLDLSGVTNTDISFLQILIAARKSALAKGQAIALSAPVSTEISDLLARTGFAVADKVLGPAEGQQ